MRRVTGIWTSRFRILTFLCGVCRRLAGAFITPAACLGHRVSGTSTLRELLYDYNDMSVQLSLLVKRKVYSNTQPNLDRVLNVCNPKIVRYSLLIFSPVACWQGHVGVGVYDQLVNIMMKGCYI